MTLLLIVLASLASGFLAVLLAAIVLLVRANLLDRAMPRLISFSTGTLLGTALLGMVPHAARSLPVSTLSFLVLCGLVLFFVLEKLLLWRHCHKHPCNVHANAGPLMLIGDAVHNFVDGIVIAGSFLGSLELGMAATLATLAHEVPQELGEYAVYRSNGYSNRRALLLNTSTSLTAVLGAVLGYYSISRMRTAGPYLLAFAAAGLLYIALADLVPSQREKTSLGLTLIDLFLVCTGIGVIALLAKGH